MKRSFFVLAAFRSILFNILMGVWSALCALCVYPFALLRIRGAMNTIARIWIGGFEALERGILGLSYTMQGRENLPAPPYIAALQHQSAWETLRLLKWFDDPAIVLKKELLRLPLWGTCVQCYGCIPVARSKKMEDLKSFLAAARKMAADKRPIVIFPQGTRVAPGASAPFNKGLVILQEDLKIPVVPITLDSGKFWGRESFVKYPGKITVRFHSPIPAGLPREALLEKLRQLFEKND